jgi:hypothetical protein
LIAVSSASRAAAHSDRSSPERDLDS